MPAQKSPPQSPLKSPFPGMDPWLENKWPEVHARLIVYSGNQLNKQLPEDLQVNIEQTLSVRGLDSHELRFEDSTDSRQVRTDINITKEPSASYDSGGVVDSTAVVVARPTLFPLPSSPDRHLQIVAGDGRLITVIEFISPWNKIGLRNRDLYARKQFELIAAGVNLVEIDLVRAGHSVLLAPPNAEEDECATTYGATLVRCDSPGEVAWFPMPLEAPLPNLPIPLRTGEADIVLRLQPIIDDCYADGRCHLMDYTVIPSPKFSDEKLAWVKQCLARRGIEL